MLVICTGIKPNSNPAGNASIRTNQGILVNEHMETSCPNVYAVGECTEFNGQLTGLVVPALEQVQVVVDTILGERETTYKGANAATSLKVMGIDLFSAGEDYGWHEDCEVIVSSNPVSGVYRKAVVKNGKVVGTVLLGDVGVGPQLSEAVKSAMPAEEIADLVVGNVDTSQVGSGSLSDETQVCDCNGISKGQIVATIQDLGLKNSPRWSRRPRLAIRAGAASRWSARSSKSLPTR